jgi:hypothetical protein
MMKSVESMGTKTDAHAPDALPIGPPARGVCRGRGAVLPLVVVHCSSVSGLSTFSNTPRQSSSLGFLFPCHVLFLSPSGSGMLLRLSYLVSLVSLPWPLASSLSFSDIRRGSAFHLPLYRCEVCINTPRRVPGHGAIGLGDYIDVCVLNYTTVVSSSQYQNIQCAGSSRRNACTARSWYAPQLHCNVCPLTPTSPPRHWFFRSLGAL